MRPASTILLAAILLWTIGCAAQSDRLADGADDVIFLLPGVAGPSREYQRVIDGLHAGAVNRPVRVVAWGAPPPLFALNFQTKSIHDRAEADLANELNAWRAKRPAGRIDLIGHSAGGGVVLGALARAEPTLRVGTVILLAPSVSPGYDLAPALAHVDERLHVFHSDRDTLFLSWRTGTFGSYDNVKTRAAGNCGFDLNRLSSEVKSRVAQHAYDPLWRELGNDGEHFGTIQYEFARRVLAPLLLTPWS
jgi:pimeloyl-ACP methyl ester carboxylesterase